MNYVENITTLTFSNIYVALMKLFVRTRRRHEVDFEGYEDIRLIIISYHLIPKSSPEESTYTYPPQNAHY